MNRPISFSYLRNMSLQIKEQKWFRSNFLISIFSVLVKSLLYFAVFHTIFLHSTQVDSNSITLYYIFVNIISLSIAPAQYAAYDHMTQINSGSIILYLLRPFSYPLSKYLNTLSLTGTRFFLNSILLVIASWVLGCPIRLGAFALGFLSVLFGFSILYLIQAVIGCFAIWFHDITRFRDVVMSLLLLLGGRLIPSDLLYSGLKRIVYYTPLPYIYDIPVKILMQTASSEMLLLQLVWIMLFAGIYAVLFQCFVCHNIEFGG